MMNELLAILGGLSVSSLLGIVSLFRSIQKNAIDRARHEEIQDRRIDAVEQSLHSAHSKIRDSEKEQTKLDRMLITLASDMDYIKKAVDELKDELRSHSREGH